MILSKQRIASYTLRNARPTRWTGPMSTGKGGGDVVIEELVLAHKGIERSRAAGRRAAGDSRSGREGQLAEGGRDVITAIHSGWLCSWEPHPVGQGIRPEAGSEEVSYAVGSCPWPPPGYWTPATPDRTPCDAHWLSRRPGRQLFFFYKGDLLPTLRTTRPGAGRGAGGEHLEPAVRPFRRPSHFRTW